MKRLTSLAALAAGLVLVSLNAQQPPQQFQPQQFQDDSGDAPDHGVARISLVNGNVSAAHGDSGDVVAAQVNAPLVASDRVMTGDASRAEVQFDAFNMIRLAPGTEIRIGELQYRRYLVQVAQGTVTFRVLRQTDAQVEISTPNSSVQPLRQGTYRITVFGDGTSEITVREGEADVFSPTGSEPLRTGTTMMSRGAANDPEFRTTAAIGFDEWDRWNLDRDRVFDRMNESSRYVSPDVYGTEELNNNGRWTNDPQYGQVWVPNAVPDWAPYRNGRWSYIDYYGWSWVSYDPWGWAPYHYGRWYQGGYGWAWYPGPVASRYYWRPALVGFFGWGSPGFGASVGFGFGNVGWVPLAPYERFRPWYGRNVYGNRFNMVNNTNIMSAYRNARVNGGVTSLRAGDFGRIPVDNRSFVRAGDRDLTRGGMVNGSLGFGPTREGRQFAARESNPRGLPAPGGNSRFFTPSRSGFTVPSDRAGWRRFGDQSGGLGAGERGRGTLRVDGFNGRDQQPVQVRPPIVTNRDGFANERRDQRGVADSFGGARSINGNTGTDRRGFPPSVQPGGSGNFGGGAGGGFDQRRFPQGGVQPSGPGGFGGGNGGSFNQRRFPQGEQPGSPGVGGGNGGGFDQRRFPQGRQPGNPGGFGDGVRGGGPRGDTGGGFGGGGMRGGGGPRGGGGEGGGNSRGGGSRGGGGGPRGN